MPAGKKAKANGKKTRGGSNSNKENSAAQPRSRKKTPAAALKTALTAQGDAALEDDEVFANTGFVWSIEDRTNLFTWLLGPDGDKLFEKLKTNPAYVHKKVCMILKSDTLADPPSHSLLKSLTGAIRKMPSRASSLGPRKHITRL